jgi:DNA ligase (NAD+)
MKFIIDKNICINDEVIVERAGEIIPHVKKAIPGLDRKQISIELCPSCDSPISYEEPIIVCTNPNCSGRHFRRFRDCITRLEIKHISDGTIKKLLDVGIKDFIDVLDMSLNDFISLEGFGQKSGQRAFDEILKLKTNGIEDWRMISSLNIPGIGDTMCEKLMSLKTPEDLYNMSIEQLMELPNIGMVRAIQIYDNLRQQASYISRFLERVNIKITKGQGSFGEIAFTGSSSKSRTEWFRIAKSHNYTPIKSVTRTLKYLVTDDVNKSSVKMDKARKYSELHGLEIITYKQFEKLIS